MYHTIHNQSPSSLSRTCVTERDFGILWIRMKFDWEKKLNRSIGSLFFYGDDAEKNWLHTLLGHKRIFRDWWLSNDMSGDPLILMSIIEMILVFCVFLNLDFAFLVFVYVYVFGYNWSSFSSSFRWDLEICICDANNILFNIFKLYKILWIRCDFHLV